MESTLVIENGTPFPFGATPLKDKVNFAIYAHESEEMTLCLFKEEDKNTPFQEIKLDPLHNKTGSVWHVAIQHLPPFTVYGYKVKIQEQEHLLLDPYATCVVSEVQWGEPLNQDRIYRPLGKVITEHSFDWEGDQFPKIPLQDMIIYEMHLRGFTQDPSSQVQHPGTYQGLIEKIPYLKELGVNAIELLPVHEFNEKEAMQVSPETQQKLYNYFGYSTVNFFAPMNRFASQSDRDLAITEFKMMVKELHKNGIEVILDVVYNHTFEGNQMGPISSYRGLDRKVYYMLNADGQYLNFSGCGNTFNCNHPIVRELILNSLRYWVTEMHVDGFRFDLASILTRAEDGTPLGNAPIVEAISKDPILADTKLIAEAWDAGGLYQVGGFVPGSPRWAEWNGKYRDIVRRFIKGTPGQKNAFASVLCGSQDMYGQGRAPTCSINFIIAHDGFTLADLVTYNGKHNEANGEDNRDGFDHNDSWNCGVEGHSTNKKIVSLRERQVRNFHLALMVSQGVPMLFMGDEYCHTKDGNNNTWCQDNRLNWFCWDRLQQHSNFYRFYRLLIDFRKKCPLLRRDTFLSDKDITWHGIKPMNADWNNDNRFVAFTLNIPDKGPELYIAFNASHITVPVTLPPSREGTHWEWVVDTHNTPPEDFLEEGHRRKLEHLQHRLPAYSAIMLQAAEGT